MNTYEEKLQFVEEEVARMLRQARAPLQDLDDKLVAAVRESQSPAQVASGHVELLVKTTTRVWAFERFLDAVRMNRESETPAEVTFNHLETHTAQALIAAATNTSSLNSSWTINATRAVEANALADIARLFQDVRKISKN